MQESAIFISACQYSLSDTTLLEVPLLSMTSSICTKVFCVLACCCFTCAGWPKGERSVLTGKKSAADTHTEVSCARESHWCFLCS